MRGGVVKSIQNRWAIRLTALLIMSVAFNGLSITRAFAQASAAMESYHFETKQTVARKITGALSKRSVNQAGGYGTDAALGRVLDLPPLPGEQDFTSTAKIQDSKKYIDEGKIPDFGKENRSSVNFAIAPLKGFQQLTDSEPLKKMFNGLSTSKVSVLFQTYYMVENGAATGHLGALNAISNLMANTMQTQDYQLKLLELTDDSGKMREAYIKRIKEALNDEGAETWPAALYAAVGDSTEFQAGGNQGMQDLPKPRAYDLKGLPTEASPTNEEETKRKLSNLLFLKREDPQNSPGRGGSSGSYSNEDLDKLKSEFVRLIGDVEIELKGEQGKKASETWLRTLNMNFIAPEKEITGDGERRGVARENWAEVQVTWEGINEILYRYCDFVKQNPNAQKKISDGQFKFVAATYSNINDPNDGNPASRPWEYISSPDIPVTMSLIEALFHMVRRTNDAKDLKCDELQLSRDDIPSQRFNESENPDLDDCGKNKGCLRNRLILHMAYIIARSRTLHTYRTMYLLSKKFATDPALDQLLDELFMRSLGGMNIDDELGKNREAWERFTLFLTKIVQGESYAGAFVRPGQFSNRAGAAPENGGQR